MIRAALLALAACADPDPACLARADAAGAVCAALCDRADRCIAPPACAADCAAAVCAVVPCGECVGEASLAECLAAVRTLACGPSELPAPCFDVLTPGPHPG